MHESMCPRMFSALVSQKKIPASLGLNLCLIFDSGVTVTTLKLEPCVSAGVSRLKL